MCVSMLDKKRECGKKEKLNKPTSIAVFTNIREIT